MHNKKSLARDDIEFFTEIHLLPGKLKGPNMARGR